MDSIQFKRIIDKGRKPTPAQLLEGEIAINLVDKTIFTKDDNGNIVAVGTGGMSAYVLKTASFSIEAKNAYALDMSDGVNKVVTIPDGLGNGDWFEVNLTLWDRGLAGLNVVFQFGTDVFTDGITDYDSLLVTTPSIISMSRVNGKWIMAKAPTMGDYGQLEQRVEDLEIYPTPPVSLAGNLLNGAYVNGSDELVGWWDSPKIFNVCGIVRVSGGFNLSVNYMTLPKVNRMATPQYRGVTASLSDTSINSYVEVATNSSQVRVVGATGASFIMMDCRFILED